MTNIHNAKLKIEVSVTFPDGTKVTEVRHDAGYDGLMLDLAQLSASCVRETRRMMSTEHWETLWHKRPEPSVSSADASRTSLG